MRWETTRRFRGVSWCDVPFCPSLDISCLLLIQAMLHLAQVSGLLVQDCLQGSYLGGEQWGILWTWLTLLIMSNSISKYCVIEATTSSYSASSTLPLSKFSFFSNLEGVKWHLKINGFNEHVSYSDKRSIFSVCLLVIFISSFKLLFMNVWPFGEAEMERDY